MPLIGTGPSEVPVNGMLGEMAYRNEVGIISSLNTAPTIASATTVQPMAPITLISGTAAIVTITVPPRFVGGGQVTFIPTGVYTTTTAGNIALASTAVVGRAMTFFYDVTTTKWYPSY